MLNSSASFLRKADFYFLKIFNERHEQTWASWQTRPITTWTRPDGWAKYCHYWHL